MRGVLTAVLGILFLSTVYIQQAVAERCAVYVYESSSWKWVEMPDRGSSSEIDRVSESEVGPHDARGADTSRSDIGTGGPVGPSAGRGFSEGYSDADLLH
jgi:hypothetical protein